MNDIRPKPPLLEFRKPSFPQTKHLHEVVSAGRKQVILFPAHDQTVHSLVPVRPPDVSRDFMSEERFDHNGPICYAEKRLIRRRGQCDCVSAARLFARKVIIALSGRDSAMQADRLGDEPDDEQLFRMDAEGRVEVKRTELSESAQFFHAGQVPVVQRVIHSDCEQVGSVPAQLHLVAPIGVVFEGLGSGRLLAYFELETSLNETLFALVHHLRVENFEGVLAVFFVFVFDEFDLQDVQNPLPALGVQ